MLEQGESTMLCQGIILDTRAAKQTLEDIEARHADIAKLETSIKDLHDMFMDMAMLVETQVTTLYHDDNSDNVFFNASRKSNLVLP